MTATVNEKTAFRLAVSFTDPDGAAYTPNTISYRIDEPDSNTVIRSATSIPSPSANVVIVITSADNRIVDASNYSERRVLTLTANDGDTDELNKEYVWNIRNLDYAS